MTANRREALATHISGSCSVKNRDVQNPLPKFWGCRSDSGSGRPAGPETKLDATLSRSRPDTYTCDLQMELR